MRKYMNKYLIINRCNCRVLGFLFLFLLYLLAEFLSFYILFRLSFSFFSGTRIGMFMKHGDVSLGYEV